MSPSAGGRLCRLVWHGPRGDLELVVPVDVTEPFDEDHWPKQGAFPMLPYANRLKDASVLWKGAAHPVRAAPGHSHGLHGVGHRRAWQVGHCSTSAVRLEWQHPADRLEWPWSFSATLEYALSAEGLHVALRIRNDATTSMPAVLGWHPYVPADWLKAVALSGSAAAVHLLDSDGICHPTAGLGAPRAGAVAVDVLRTPHTLALEKLCSPWSMQAASGERWCLNTDAPHLVLHVPPDRAYACIEPVSALPGALGAPAGLRSLQDMELAPGSTRELTSRLMMAP